MNALLDAAIDHPLFWPAFVLLWFVASALVGWCFGGVTRRFNS